MLSVAFELCFSVHLLPAVHRSSSALLLYSVLYLRVLAAIVFPLSLCTQPPYFRGGRFAGVATSFRLVRVEEESGTLWLLRPFQWGEFFLWDSHLYLCPALVL